MAYNNDNVFAKILRGELPCKKVFENNNALAFEDIQPQAPVHILVIPKGSYISMDDFSENASEQELSDFFRAVGKVARDAGVVERGYRLLANHGDHGRQEVPHFHVHILGGRDLGGMIAPSKI